MSDKGVPATGQGAVAGENGLMKLVLAHNEYLLLRDIARFWLATKRWVDGASPLGKMASYSRWIATPIRWRAALGLDVSMVLAPFMGIAMPVRVITCRKSGDLYCIELPAQAAEDIASWISVISTVRELGMVSGRGEADAVRIIEKCNSLLTGRTRLLEGGDLVD